MKWWISYWSIALHKIDISLTIKIGSPSSTTTRSEILKTLFGCDFGTVRGGFARHAAVSSIPSHMVRSILVWFVLVQIVGFRGFCWVLMKFWEFCLWTESGFELFLLLWYFNMILFYERVQIWSEDLQSRLHMTVWLLTSIITSGSPPKLPIRAVEIPTECYCRFEASPFRASVGMQGWIPSYLAFVLLIYRYSMRVCCFHLIWLLCYWTGPLLFSHPP